MNLSRCLPILMLCLLSSCSEDEFELSGNSSVNNPPTEETIPRWLESHHNIHPADWLGLRSYAALGGEVTSRLQLVDLLQAASRCFRESPRMIANRAVQLEDMLLEIGIEESAVSLIEHFTRLPAESTPHHFSAYCQYYFNLRAKGHSQDYALAGRK